MMSKKLAGKVVSPIGIGTWKMGGRDAANHRYDARDIASLRWALDHGINVIDTAEMYGNGHAEELVGEAIRGREREELCLITKVLPTHLKPEALTSSAKASLKRLRTPYVDLYLIHWPPSKMELVREGISAMEKLVDAGLVRSIGVSNFDVDEMRYAIEATRDGKIEANQIEYSLLHRESEREVLPFCKKNDIKVIAYTPLAEGKVADIPDVKEVAGRTGHTPIQVALNFLMKRSIPIPKASTLPHLNEILGSVGWELSRDGHRLLEGT